MLGPDMELIERGGYVTDLITDDCIDWLDRRDPERPFALLCHHKAPHRAWEPAPRHFTLFDDIDLPEPETLFDDNASRSAVVQAVRMRLSDLDPVADLRAALPEGLTPDEELRWRYQHYVKLYVRTVAAIDDSVGRLLDWLDHNGLADDTVVVYTSDQGFFLGDHGWFDKRLMYEESIAMPLLVRYPRLVAPGRVCTDMALNVDLAPTMVDLAGKHVPWSMQGVSLVPLLRGERPGNWRTSMYYRYWMHNDGAHHVPAHYGVRTARHKLICFYNDPLRQPGANGPAEPVEWELYDLVEDPAEVRNVFDDPAYATVVSELKAELSKLQSTLRDRPFIGAR